MLISSNPELDRKKRLAMAMLSSGMKESGAPVQHWTQGLNRALQMGLGAYMGGKFDKESKQAREQTMSDISAVLNPVGRTPDGSAMQAPRGQDLISALMNVRGIDKGALAEMQLASQLKERMGAGKNAKQAYAEWYMGLPPEQRAMADQAARGDNYLNLGGIYFDPRTGKSFAITPKVSETPEFKGAVTKAQEEAKADVASATEAKGIDIGKIEQDVNRLFGYLSNPEAEKVTGFLGGARGMVERARGSEAGVIAAGLERYANEMVLSVADQLSGPKSDKDIEFLKATMPKQGDDIAIWKDWYTNTFKARMETRAKEAGVAVNFPSFEEATGGAAANPAASGAGASESGGWSVRAK